MLNVFIGYKPNFIFIFPKGFIRTNLISDNHISGFITEFLARIFDNVIGFCRKTDHNLVNLGMCKR